MAGWISETMAARKAAQARLGLTEAPPERMSEEQLAAIVDAFGGLLGLLRRADQHDRAEIYTRIGLQMTYRPGTETVLAGGQIERHRSCTCDVSGDRHKPIPHQCRSWISTSP